MRYRFGMAILAGAALALGAVRRGIHAVGAGVGHISNLLNLSIDRRLEQLIELGGFLGRYAGVGKPGDAVSRCQQRGLIQAKPLRLAITDLVRMGFGKQLDFVQSYWQQIQSKQATPTSGTRNR